MKIKIKYIACAVFIGGILLLGIESYLWRGGYGDFPFYDVDEEIGYVPKPSTAGQFAGRYGWYFNAQSMRNEPFVGDPSKDVLLLGDSIVFGGGIDLLPEEKLGACLQRLYTEGRVWSASAGSWAFPNEHTYLKRHPEVVSKVSRIIWIVNSGDFDERTHWSSNLSHPVGKPRLLSLYLAQKWWVSRVATKLPSFGKPVPLLPPVLASDIVEELKHLSPELRAKCVFVGYPTKRELTEQLIVRTPSFFDQLGPVFKEAGLNLRIITHENGWRSDCYRDVIHPTADGNRTLAIQLIPFLQPRNLAQKEGP